MSRYLCSVLECPNEGTEDVWLPRIFSLRTRSGEPLHVDVAGMLGSVKLCRDHRALLPEPPE